MTDRIDPAASASVAPDDVDLTQLLCGVDSGDLQVVEELLRRRPELANARGADGQTPLHTAAWCNDGRLAVLLLAYGADPRAKYGQSGHDALSWAATCGSIDFARTLVELGTQPDLFCAAGMGLIDEVRAFFDESGELFPEASRTGSSRLAADGTRLPCPSVAPTELVSDALYIASRNAQLEVVRFLLTKKPDLSFKAYMGGTALHWANFGGSRDVIELLEQAGADHSARDDVLQCTPRAFGICVPANWGIIGQVQKRLAEDPTLANLMDGRTSPLHEAARRGHAEIVRLLLAAGADPALPDGDGKTPLQVAETSGQAEILKLLRDATPPDQGIS